MDDPLADALAVLMSKREAIETSLDSIERWALFFGVLVVIGVAGETVFGVRTWWNSRKLHTLQLEIDETHERIAKRQSDSMQGAISAADARAADANDRASAANERASKNEKDAQQFRKEAARLSKLAEDERLARLQLEARLADRNLSDEQLKRLTDNATVFSGISVDILTFGESAEITGMANLLRMALGKAGWRINSAGVIPGPGAIVRGIGIATRSGADGRSIRAADSLAIDLQTAGIVTAVVSLEKLPDLKFRTMDTGTGTAPVVIVIGSKP